MNPKFFKFAFSLIYLLTLSASQDDRIRTLELNETTYENFSNSQNRFLITFYLPYSHKSHEIIGLLDQHANFFGRGNVEINITKLDITKYPEIAKKYPIDSIPYTVVQYNKTFTPYRGCYGQNDLKSFFLKNTYNETEQADSVSGIEQFKNSILIDTKIIFIGNDKKKINIFRNLARKFRNLEFKFCDTEECETTYEVYNNIVIYKLNERRVVYKGNFTEDEISKFIIENSRLQFTHYKEYSIEKYMNEPILMYYFDQSRESEVVEIVKKVSNRLKHHEIHSIINNKNDSTKLKFCDLSRVNEKEETVRIIVRTQGKFIKYKYQEDSLDEDKITEFVENYFSGKLNPFLASENREIVNHDSIYDLTGNTYYSFLKENKDKHKIILFYTPNCGFCEKALAFLKSISKLKIENLIFSKINMITNEIPDLDFPYYPYLGLIKGGEETLNEFTTKYNEESFIRFLETKIQVKKLDL